MKTVEEEIKVIRKASRALDGLDPLTKFRVADWLRRRCADEAAEFQSQQIAATAGLLQSQAKRLDGLSQESAEPSTPPPPSSPVPSQEDLAEAELAKLRAEQERLERERLVCAEPPKGEDDGFG